MSKALDRQLLDAHARGDKHALVTLYTRAGETAQSEDARYFYLTHAYIFALDTGHPRARALLDKLKAAGREA
jgi:hypothetical protein